MSYFALPRVSRRFVATMFDLNALVSTTIFSTAATDLLLVITDDTVQPPLLPIEAASPLHRDSISLLTAVTSSGGTVQNASPDDVQSILASAGDQFT